MPLRNTPATRAGKIRLCVLLVVAVTVMAAAPLGPRRDVSGAHVTLQPASGSTGTFSALAVTETRTSMLWWLTGGKFNVVFRQDVSAPAGRTVDAIDTASVAAYSLARIAEPDVWRRAQVSATLAIEHSPADRYGITYPAYASPALVEGLNATLVGIPEARLADAGIVGLQGGSLGLPAALAQLDRLTAGDLTAGLNVAATGAIDAAGHITPVRGLEFKAHAARDLDADVMFVPGPPPSWMGELTFEELDAAAVAGRVLDRQADPAVVAVSSLAEAVLWLCDHSSDTSLTPVCAAAHLVLTDRDAADRIATGR